MSYLRGQDLVTLYKSAILVSLLKYTHAEKPMLPEHCFPEKHNNILFFSAVYLMLCRNNITHYCDET